MVDIYGSKVPYDKQYMLQTAYISMDLIYYETNVLYKWLQGIPGASPNPGTGAVGAAGDLAIQNGLAARLLIKSTPSGTGVTSDEDCWNFPNAILLDTAEVKLGTKTSVWRLKFQALLTQNTCASNGAVLWSTVCS